MNVVHRDLKPEKCGGWASSVHVRLGCSVPPVPHQRVVLPDCCAWHHRAWAARHPPPHLQLPVQGVAARKRLPAAAACTVCPDSASADAAINKAVLRTPCVLVQDGGKRLLKAIDFGLSAFFVEGERKSEVVGSPFYMCGAARRASSTAVL